MKKLLCRSLKKSDLPLKTGYLNVTSQLINHLHNFTFSHFKKKKKYPKNIFCFWEYLNKKIFDFQLGAPNNDGLDQGVALFRGWGAYIPQQWARRSTPPWHGARRVSLPDDSSTVFTRWHHLPKPVGTALLRDSCLWDKSGDADVGWRGGRGVRREVEFLFLSTWTRREPALLMN